MRSSILLHMSGYDVIALVVEKKERWQHGLDLLTNKGGDEWVFMIRVDCK
jgi:hypothetical protein